MPKITVDVPENVAEALKKLEAELAAGRTKKR
jgi:hypothetical protein